MEFAIDSLFVYASIIGSIVAIIYLFMRKKRAR
ncbi:MULTISPECIES: EYxxD motif small membrane protein [Alkalihalobacterium]